MNANASTMKFSKAVRKRAKLRVAIEGPAGSGKTTAALQIATGLGGRTAVIDTERGSASLYSDQYTYDTMELDPPYAPERFIEAVQAAEAAGYDNLILDSITHEWNGSGGCLDINETIAQIRYKGNTWSAWNETTPRHRAFIDALLQSNMHIIATMRSKTETVQDAGGKVRKIGMKAEQREGGEYEFTLVFSLEHQQHLAVVTKNRTPLFRGDATTITADTGRALLAWLESGVAPIMAAEDLEAHLHAIEAANSIDELKAAFIAASAAGTASGDMAATAAIVKAKDARKGALTLAVAS